MNKPTTIEMSCENEKMLCKHRYNLSEHGRGDTSCIIKTVDEKVEHHVDKQEKVEKIWAGMRKNVIYDPCKKIIHFNHVRPTNYRWNKHINLPKPLKSSKEMECETRS